MKNETDTAEPLVPPRPTLKTLRESAAACRACPLCERGTVTVFGEGPARPGLLLVGEQPGNEEDLSGRPFAGPAGRLLDTAGPGWMPKDALAFARACEPMYITWIEDIPDG